MAADLSVTAPVTVVDGRARVDLGAHGLSGAAFRKTLGDRGGRIGDVSAVVDGEVLVLEVDTPNGAGEVVLEGRWVHGEVALRSIAVTSSGVVEPEDDFAELLRAQQERKRVIAEDVTGRSYTDD